MWIIVKFYPLDNTFQYFGPFATEKAALDYGEGIWGRNLNQAWGAIKLVAPMNHGES